MDKKKKIPHDPDKQLKVGWVDGWTESTNFAIELFFYSHLSTR